MNKLDVEFQAPAASPPENESPPHCKWYVSFDHQECGEPAVAEVTHVIIRGRPKALDEPLPVCFRHKKRNDLRFAQVRASHK